MTLDFKKIEKKWQDKWAEAKLFSVSKNNNKEKFYVLEMFPYPSGDGLHMGHAWNYTIGDIFARFKRMNGLNVLHPMGYDALGLPAENAAIKQGTHPQDYTKKSSAYFKKQQEELGLTYDWDRLISSADPQYYKWDQWIFIQMLKKGLAYQKTSSVNWCPKCNTVLANEQVENGNCWRHDDTPVEVKSLKQWFLKITDYADELFESIDKLDWPKKTKAMQKNWIGKSHGTQIMFEINGQQWPIFTTRPDTIFGVTFMVVAAQHPRLDSLVTDEQKDAVDKFLQRTHSVSEKELETMEKDGVFTGSYAINPLTKEKIPIYAGNFVVASYGSGMVMAVPAHDQRDFEFATKYNIPIKEVICPPNKTSTQPLTRAYTQAGILCNSGKFNGLDSQKAKTAIRKTLEEKGCGKAVVQFKLRDWGISRQRYWGTPIPIVHCKTCGAVPIPEEELPVKLPRDVTFGQGNPLETNEEWKQTRCPRCGSQAIRETDTMDTFVNSSWYYLRYTDPQNDQQIFDPEKANYWTPVDLYIGGAEHACMHLIYFRFYHKFLRDLGLVESDEPVKKLFHQGMLHGADGNKMSKSKGNGVLPEDVSKTCGIDTARLFLASVASPEKNIDWSETGIEGSLKFVERIDQYIQEVTFSHSAKKVESKLHKTIKKVTHYIEDFKYNLAIIAIRELFSEFEKEIAKPDMEMFLKLLNPFCPHLTEHWWETLGNKPFISDASWPQADESKIDEEAEALEEIGKQTLHDIRKVLELTKISSPQHIEIIVADQWKFDFFEILKQQLEQTRNGAELIKYFMSQKQFRPYGKDITKLIPGVLKDASKLPQVITSQHKEYQAIIQFREELQEVFDCKVVVTKAQDSDHPKVRQASPSKPAIVIS